MKRFPKSIGQRRPARRGATLIDVAAGSMLLAVLLIPSMRLISDSQSSSRRLHNRDTVLYEAEQLIEASKMALAETAAFNAAWSSPSDTTGRISVSDGPDLTSRLRISADTTMPTARLLNITVDVWIDSNGNLRLDANELSESLRTQWASP